MYIAQKFHLGKWLGLTEQYTFLIEFISFIMFLLITIESKRKKIDCYKSNKFYENTYLYHIPNSRIMNDLRLE